MTEQKEILLKTKILDEGYDPQAFVDFMNNLKPGSGDDIDAVTYQELEQAIFQFQQKAIPNLQGNDILMSKFEPIYSQINTLAQDDLEDEFYTKITEVGLLESNSLERAAEICINSFEKKPGSLFSYPYIVYQIVVEPNHYEVKRRYNDFFWMRETLEKLYPGLLIPPIPSKTPSRSTEDSFINKRMYILNKFLKDCLNSPVIRKCDYFEQFLCQKDDVRFSRVQKQSERIQKFTNIGQLSNSTGQVSISIGPVKEQVKICTDYVYQKDCLLSELNIKSKQLFSQYKEIQHTMSQMSDIFNKLSVLSEQLNQVIERPISYIKEIYLSASRIMDQFGTYANQQADLVKQNIQFYFKYCRKECQAIKQQDYERFKMRLNQKKDRLFATQDISKWELNIGQTADGLLRDRGRAIKVMCWKESDIMKDLRDLYGYLNNTAYEEIMKNFKEGVKSWLVNGLQICTKQRSLLCDQHMFWSQLQSSFEIISIKNN